jgi:rhamnosyltransferase
MDALSIVGGVRSNYFIDHVDTEWCFRARELGYKLLGVHDAFLEHSLGDTVKQVWFFYMRQVAYHSPLRDYYMFRNTILMLRDVGMHFTWQAFMLIRLLQFAVYFLLFTRDRKQRARCMLLGLVHGIRGGDGKVDLAKGLCTKIPATSLDPR